MALNIKDAVTESMAAELAALTGETKTGAVRTALRERLRRLHDERRESLDERHARLRRLLEDEIWPQLPNGLRGQTLTKATREEILGYGPEGY